MNRLYLILLVSCFVALAGSAHELRIWEDVDGNQFEGRFLRELFGKLTIEAEDGVTRIFELQELSELDKKYLRVMVPPSIEVVVKTYSVELPDRPMFLPTDEESADHWVSVLVSKKTQRPFTSRLKLEIFMVAEELEGPNRILLSRTEKEFLFPATKKGSEITIKSERYRTEVFRDVMSSELKGEAFEGYIVVITTMQGELVLIKSDLPSWAETPEVINNLRELSIRGASSVRSRHFDKTGKKVPVPRPENRHPAYQ